VSRSAARSSAPPVDGILNLDKPEGWTSHDVVAWVRRTLGQRSVGHAGTLDPMATGVLLVCVGQATRVVEYLTAGDKVYRAVARLGAATDTYDRTGQITTSAPVPELSQTALNDALAPFIGAILQTPPAYSAIKQEGVAAYQKARRGETVTLAPRPVTIYGIAILDWTPPDLTLEVQCGPGTYIRSLAHDLGQALGCGAHLASLVRTRSGSFTVADAASLEALGEAAIAGEVGRYLQPIQAALYSLQAVPVDADAAGRLAHGLPILCDDEPAGTTGYAQAPDGAVLAVLNYHDGHWWPHKVFTVAN
jgi:tRNA pseudouridine55 synthase